MFKIPKGWGVVKPWDRHSFILIIAGFSYILTGLIYSIDVRTPEQEQVLYYAKVMMPITCWGYLFIGVGIVTLISVRWPSWPKSLGYMVLTGQAAAWSTFYVAGSFQANGDAAGFSSGMVWALVAFLWWGISGLISPKEVGGG